MKNGFLAVQVAPGALDDLFRSSKGECALTAEIDLEAKSIRWNSREAGFLIDDTSRERLLEGLDDIAATLEHREDIKAYEARRRKLEPWLFPKRT